MMHEKEKEKDQGASLLRVPPSAAVTTEALPISVPVTTEELEWVLHAASLRNLTLVEYVRRAINLSLRKEGVDAVLLMESDDDCETGPLCESCDEPATCLTSDDVDMCAECYQALCDEQNVTGQQIGSGTQSLSEASGPNGQERSAEEEPLTLADQPHETIEQAKTELYAALRGLDDVGDHAGSPHEAAENRFDYAVNRLIAAALAQGRAQQEVVACPICAVWTGFPVEVLEHIRERHAQQEAEITRLKTQIVDLGDAWQKGYSTGRAAADSEWYGKVEAAEASLAEQEQEIQRLTAQSTWQDIATAPKDGSGVVVIDAGTPVVVHWSEQYEMWEDMNGDFCEPRHWMPLPPPPVIERGSPVQENE